MKLSFIFGTRPEAIKLAPLIIYFKNKGTHEINVCVTAQHRQMLDQVLEIFEITPDVDLNLMKPNQSLSELTANAINSLNTYFTSYKPDAVFVQGDTTTVFAASLVAFYHKVKVIHVEAGLRTNNKYSPFPEEINRQLTSKLTDLHLAPTQKSYENLVKEGIPKETIFITGNTVIDALFMVKNKAEKINKINGLDDNLLSSDKKIVLITGHRRENFGEGFQNICKAIKILSEKFPEHHFIYPVHLNPNVQKPVYEILGNSKNIHLIEPQTYLPFIKLMLRSDIILTDSGGVQEEAPSLGKPVLVMRENTERPEAVEAGTVKLVGTNIKKIVSEATLLLTDKNAYDKMARAINPYGDGKACERIYDIVSNNFYLAQTV